MKNTTGIWLIVAASLLLIGCIVFGVVMSIYQWDFTKLSTVKLVTNHHEISQTFQNIRVNTETADIIFAVSGDGQCRVECFEENKAKHSVTVQEDTLVISVVDQKLWYDHIGFSFNSPKITVYLPKADYGALKIKETTGKIDIPKDFLFESIDISLTTGDVSMCASASDNTKINTTTGRIYADSISAGSLDLSSTTGDIQMSDVTCTEDINIHITTGITELTNITCKNFTSNGSTGKIFLKNVVAEEKLSITRSTGSVTFDGSDADEIMVEVDTGSVTGTLLSEKTFIAESNTGKVDVPKTTNGGKCEITTSTGDIKLEIVKK